ncbi:MAG: gamma-glutamyl-gamma-aminobutyrate hydrolase family protein [Acidimicrobiales bacterium]
MPQPRDVRPDRAMPLIAVTGCDQQARWGAWDDRATLVPSAYLLGVHAAGGVPVVVAPSADAKVIAERVDGLLLTGGVDLAPALYGQDPHAQTQEPDEERDAFETTLLETCIQRGIAVLAVCRGLQVLNVARGGSLDQHLPDTVGNSVHLPTPGAFAGHWVRIGAGTRLARIIGQERVEVPTHHHQAVGRLGSGLVPTAWADDGVVEAAEDPSAAFLVAVQWHPEAGEDPSLFEALVAASST